MPRPSDTPPPPDRAGSATAAPRLPPHGRDWDEGRRWPALLLIAGLHVAALWGALQLQPVREAIQEVAPIMVGLITVPPAPEPPKPEPPPPPKPRPPTVKPKPKPQVIAAETAAPAEMVAPPPPEPEPVVVEEPPPPAPAPPAPAPIIPPNFVAAYLDNPPPRYPPSSRRLGEAGTVTLSVRVNVNGRPDAVDVHQSSGYPRLDRAAVEAVRNWKFVPARQGDKPVPATVLVPLSFELKS